MRFASAPAPASGSPPAPNRRKLSNKERQEFRSLEGDLEKLSAKKAEYEALLVEGGQGAGFSELAEWSKRIETLTKEIEEKTERWFELAEMTG